MANSVGYHNHVCIKLKTGQVHRQFIHVGNSEQRKAQLSNQAVHYGGFLHDCCPEKKITLNLASSNYPC